MPFVEKREGLTVRVGLFGLILGGVGFGIAGCEVPPVHELVIPEAIIDERYFPHELVDLTPAALEKRMAEIDELYAEPRTPAKVAHSLEASRASISQVNNYGGLWRFVRSAAWLAGHHPDRAERRYFAREGIAAGRYATRRVSNRVEPFYYLSLCELSLMDLDQALKTEVVNELENNLKIAVALAPSFDHCGPHRALGNLLLKTTAYPLLGVTSTISGYSGVRGALEHLRKAAESCADYGQNHLALARALIRAGEYELARAELENVITSGVPSDRTAEHGRWLDQANDLMVDLQGK